jgi:hypothetical protein
MPGINLSRSAEQATELKKHDSFGRGAVSVVIVLVLALAAWGGVSYYGKKLSAEIDGVTSEIDSKKGVFSSADIDDVADFHFRLEIVKAGLGGRISPAGMLGSVEELILPGVRLTEYSFDATAKEIVFAGEADTLGTIAKQMVIVKRIPQFSGLSVDSISRTEDGKFEFGFSISLVR